MKQIKPSDFKGSYQVKVKTGSLPMIGKNEYQCENCKEVFTKSWSDEEAEEEAQALWGEELLENNPAVICDDCFNAITGVVPSKGIK